LCFEARAARRWQLRISFGLASLLSWLASGPAHAQQTPPDEYFAVPVQTGSMLSLWGGETYAPGQYALALSLEVHTLVSVEQPPAVARRGTASSFDVLGSLGAWQGADISAGLALQATNFETAAGNAAGAGRRAALGDVRVIPRFRLWAPPAGSGLALLFPVWIPTPLQAAYLSPGLRIEPRLALTGSGGPWTVTANAGYALHATEADFGVRSTNFVSAGVGAELRVIEAWSLLGELAGRWSPHDRRATTDWGGAAEARLAARFATKGWAAQFGAGTALLGAARQPAWRMLASVSFGSSTPELVAPPAAEPHVTPPEDAGGYSSEASDWQAQAALDAAAANDAASGSAPPAAPAHETPPRQTSPALPAAAAATPVATAGPSADAEKAPEVRRRSTPSPRTGRVRAGWRAPAAITEVLHFRANQTLLSAAQIATLRAVARQLLAAPPDARLVVQGHSDSTGPKALNGSVSRLRAANTRYQLLRMGMPWRRIIIQAFGATRPIGKRRGRLANGQNRRVEFRWSRAD
jgi:outer membrane protein OmpA-like peptidoglycan-associated protein